MRSANVEEKTEISFYTREQVADFLGIHRDYLRSIVAKIRSALDPKEFDYCPYDGQISADAFEKIVKFKALSDQKTIKAAVEHIKSKGI